MGIIVVLMGMVAVIVPTVQENGRRTQSLNYVRQMAQLMSERSMRKRWPSYSGKSFTLSLVADGVIDPSEPKNLEIFFSPGDELYRLDRTDVSRYNEVTKQALRAGSDFHELTSYAGRRNDIADREFLITPAKLKKTVPIICDDDDGNCHHVDGLVMSYTDGAARFVEWGDIGMTKPEDPDQPEPFLGDNATVDYLRGLSSE
jgi:hypothetical protein